MTLSLKAISSDLGSGAQAVLAIACDLSPRTRLTARNCDMISEDPGMLPGFMSALSQGLHNMERNELGSGTRGEHRMLTGAGWSYRTNDRGWIIYRDPQTRRWHTLNSALSVMRSAMRVAAPPKLAS